MRRRGKRDAAAAQADEGAADLAIAEDEEVSDDETESSEETDGTDDGSEDGSEDGSDGSSEEEELQVDTDGRLAVGGRLDYTTRCFDGALRLTDAEADALRRDCGVAFTARAAARTDEYSAGSTFWVGADATPKTRIERLALDIFHHHARDAVYRADCSGAEWWTHVLDVDDAEIGFHWDRDYDLEADQGLYIHPHVATVTYLSHDGAPTLVTSHASPLLASEPLTADHVDEAVASWPRLGRHLVFDGRLLHGAPASLAAPPPAGGRGKGAARSEAPRKRISFLVNVWLNHTPWGAAPMPQPMTAQLGTGRVPFAIGAATGGRRGGGAAGARVEAKSFDATGSDDCTRLSWRFGDGDAPLELSLPMPQRLLARALSRAECPGALARVRFAREDGARVAPPEAPPKKSKKRPRA